VRPAEQRRIRTFVPTVSPLRGSAGPKVPTCSADLFGAGGSGLSKTSPRALLVAVFSTVLGIMAFAAVPALASKPEAPEVSGVVEVRSTHALVFGVLNPNALAPGEAGTYQYVYRPSINNECKGAGEVKFPEPPEMSLGLQHEELEAKFLGGLEPGTEYAICLVATEPGKTEPAVSAPVSFKTHVPPETPATQAASEISGTSATLNAVLSPNKPGSAGELYQFLYRPGTSECQGPGNIEAPTEPALASGEQAQHVSLTVTGLQPKTPYVYCVRALSEDFEESRGAEQTFTTPAAPPSIVEESIANVDPTEATVAAKIASGGLPSSYDVEYEPGVTTSEVSLPATTAPVAVSQRITGLKPGTEYHYRFIAHNELGFTEGAGETLSTTTTIVSTGGGSSCTNAKFLGFDPALPECRAYELVSSADEVGEVYDPGGENGREQDINTARPFRAAADGGSVAYVADPGPSGGGDGSTAKRGGNEYLARRGPASSPGGWESVNITPPVGAGEAGFKREFEAFSSDLSVGVVQSERLLEAAHPSPQAPAGCGALYAWRQSLEAGTFGALFSETLVPGECGQTRTSSFQAGLDTTLMFDGETADHTRRVFQTSAALAGPAVASSTMGGDIYESDTDEHLTVVNRLPSGEVEPHATVGGPSDYPENSADLSGAVSESGSRVVWTGLEQGESIGSRAAAQPSALYDREDPDSPSAETVQLDKAESGATGASGQGQYWGASTDGSRVFFTDCSRLTWDSTAISAEGCLQVRGSTQLLHTGNDLYEYDFARPEGERLVDLTVDKDPGDGLGADVQGVVGVSNDGTYIYFVAGGALGAAPNGGGEVSTARTCIKPEEPGLAKNESEGKVPTGFGCNLFVEHYNGSAWEAPQFIATLAAIDNETNESPINAPLRDTGEVSGDWVSNIGSRTAEVSPSGGTVVFSSTQDLTGYDTSSIGALGAEEGLEVFVYDAGSGKLACASCSPTGAPPIVAIQQGQTSNGVTLPGIETGSATYLPVSSSNTFMHRWVNAQGSEVFFDSSQPLVSGDSNGTQDVYEWEAEGASSCPRSTSRYGGCVFLLSGGESPDWSYLADADENGEDVFIVHRGPLGGAGPRDDKFQLYDVRVGGGFAESSLGCTGTGCQGVPPAAPIFATPASVTFSGVGNFQPPEKAVPKPKAKPLTRAQKLAKALLTCRKKPKRNRIKCEQQARQKYGIAKSKRSVKSNRRAK
jgi:hypothetical protein